MTGKRRNTQKTQVKVDKILSQLKENKVDVLQLLKDNYDEQRNEIVPLELPLYRAFVKRLIETGHPTRGYELAREGAQLFENEPHLRYLQAWAAARFGNTDQARSMAKDLLRTPNLDGELRHDSMMLVARLYKDQYESAVDANQKAEFARKAAKQCLAASEFSRKSYPRINAATMSLLAGTDETTVRNLALQAIDLAKAEVDASTSETWGKYWLLATIGEGYLIHEKYGCDDPKDPEGALYWYRLAVEKAGDRVGDIASMRRQVRLLTAKRDMPEEIFKVFATGNVVIFSGHMIDHPSRAADGLAPRFPYETELVQAVSAEIEKKIVELDARIGYVSAACGSDILFAEKMLERIRHGDATELHVVLPFDRNDFYAESVDYGQTSDEWQKWRERCDLVLDDRATQVHFATHERFLGDEVLFAFVNRFTQGLAITRAKAIDASPQALVVRDAGSKTLLGGTSFFIEAWERQNRQCHEIDLAELRNAIPNRSGPTHSFTEENNAGGRGAGLAAESPLHTISKTAFLRTDGRQIKAMLFADVKGFSQLGEEQTRMFFYAFLKEVSDRLDQAQVKPVFQNTWGDGLYLVFAEPEDCADFALELSNIDADFSEIGLPEDLKIRVGIHVGPVFTSEDPIIGKTNFFGSHVNRAARIEPVTMPGCVYASEQMAALLGASQRQQFTLEYVGVEKLAKEYDRCALYRVARRG